MKMDLKIIFQVYKKIFNQRAILKLIGMIYVYKILMSVYEDYSFFSTYLEGGSTLSFFIYKVFLPSLQDMLIWLWIAYMGLRGQRLVSLVLPYLAYQDYFHPIHQVLFGETRIVGGNYGLFKIWFIFEILLVLLVVANTVLYLRYLWEIRPKR